MDRVRRRGWKSWVATSVVVFAATVGGVAYAAMSPAGQPLQADGSDAEALDGLTVEVVALEQSAGGTDVTLEVRGRDDRGELASPAGRTRLVLDNGETLGERQGRTDGRVITLTYPAVPPDRQPDRLEIAGLHISDGGDRLGSPPHFEVDYPVRVDIPTNLR